MFWFFSLIDPLILKKFSLKWIKWPWSPISYSLWDGILIIWLSARAQFINFTNSKMKIHVRFFNLIIQNFSLNFCRFWTKKFRWSLSPALARVLMSSAVILGHKRARVLWIDPIVQKRWESSGTPTHNRWA